MLDKQNIIVDYIEAPQGNKGIVFQVAHEVYLKMVDYLRLTQAKNTFNRLSDYHYLNIAVSNSTEPIRGIDYINPVVAPFHSFPSLSLSSVKLALLASSLSVND